MRRDRPLTTVIAKARRVLNRKHVPARDARGGAAPSSLHHLSHADTVIAQEAGQPHLPAAAAAQPAHRDPALTNLNQSAVKKDPPFSSRRSPKLPSPNSIAAASSIAT